MTKALPQHQRLFLDQMAQKNVEVDTTKRGHRHLSLKMVKGEKVMVNQSRKQSFESSPPKQVSGAKLHRLVPHAKALNAPNTLPKHRVEAHALRTPRADS